MDIRKSSMFEEQKEDEGLKIATSAMSKNPNANSHE